MNGKGILEELLLFLKMDTLETGGHGSTRRTTSVENVATVVVLSLVEQSLNTRLGVAPGTRIQRLLLAPHNVAGIGVTVEVLLKLSPREGMKLLDTSDGSVADTICLTVLHQRSVNLSGAQNDTLDLLRLINRGAMGRVRDDPLEVGFASEVLNVGAGNRMTEKRLREEDYKS
jgi:hypothetical protein